MTIANPINRTQRDFNRLCELGSGRQGGPARTRVQELLRESGQSLNQVAYEAVSSQLAELPDQNPWHVCFALGLSWGHLAQLDSGFTAAAANLLHRWNDNDLRTARQFPLDRGPDPIEHSLKGGYMLFQRMLLPDSLPDSLRRYSIAQERWLSHIITGPNRPPYIGSWNSTAMFMMALSSNESLASELTTPTILLPSGGPVYNGLTILHRTHILSRPPSGTELDDEAFEPGAIYENNVLFQEIRTGLNDWNLLAVHSGLYMLGTRRAESNSWF